jgi:hypothetical protein
MLIRVSFTRFFVSSTVALSASLVAACGGSASPRVALQVVFPKGVAGDAEFAASGMWPTATPTSPDTASGSFTGARHFAFTPGGAAPLTVSALACSGPARWHPDGPSGAYTGLDVTLSGGQQESCTVTLSTNDSDGDGVLDREDGCPHAPSRTPDGCPGFTVASIGDSVASGEGNPPWGDKPGDKSCHRSNKAGPALGFSWLEASAPAQFASEQFSLYHLACSGAQITDGILLPYDGAPTIPKLTYRRLSRLVKLAKKIPGLRRLPELPPYPAPFRQSSSQLDQLPRSEDALLISAGANDLGFSDILVNCVMQGIRQYVHLRKRWRRDCRDSKAGDIFDLNRQDLKRRYKQLSERLTAQDIPPNRVYITEYFDPTRGSGGNYCSHVLTIHREADLRWADQTVLETLNKAVHDAASKYGWHPLGRIASGFREGHGYCAKGRRSWIRRFTGSLLHQKGNPFGVMHPNNGGQRCYATRIWEDLYEHLYRASPASAEPVGVERGCL